MPDLRPITEEVTTLPRLKKRLTLTEGQSIKDDADVLAFASMTVPAGKVADILVKIYVIKLDDVEI